MTVALTRPDLASTSPREVAAAPRTPAFRAPGPASSATAAPRAVTVTLTLTLPPGTADVEAARLADALRTQARRLSAGQDARASIRVDSPHPFTRAGGAPSRTLPPAPGRTATAPRRGGRGGIVSPTAPARRDIAELRRRELQARAVSPSSPNPAGRASFVLDLAGRRLRIDGEDVDLTYKEFELLAHLARHARRIVTREELMESVWADAAAETRERTVDVHIRRLRAKLGRFRRLISTARGQGYRLDPGSDVAILGDPTV